MKSKGPRIVPHGSPSRGGPRRVATGGLPPSSKTQVLRVQPREPVVRSPEMSRMRAARILDAVWREVLTSFFAFDKHEEMRDLVKKALDRIKRLENYDDMKLVVIQASTSLREIVTKETADYFAPEPPKENIDELASGEEPGPAAGADQPAGPEPQQEQ